jgi:hypothetical protein
MRLEIHFEAREEFLQAAQFYETQVPGLGQRFINEIERCQKALLEAPLIGQPYGRRPAATSSSIEFPASSLMDIWKASRSIWVPSTQLRYRFKRR